MLDVNIIRKDPEAVRAGVRKKRADPKLVDRFIRFDEEWRAKVAALDQMKAEQNILSRELAKGTSEDLLSKAEVVKKRLTEMTEERDILEGKRDEVLGKLPNLPFPDVPEGPDESGNKVLREVGEKTKFDFEAKDYLTLAEGLGILDVKKAAEVSGSRFSYLLGDAVLLEFALVQLALEVAGKRGFVPVVPPVMIRPKVFEGMGSLAGDQKEERYLLEKDNLYLVGSAENTLGPLHMDDTFEEGNLPRRYAGFSVCLRREAGSYGKDTKGILRVHQFDKVELFSFTKPADSEREHQLLLALEEELMQKLELPYRVVEICTGDMGWNAARQFDIETWFPGQGAYRETHSCSNTTDFQSRGVNIKYRTKEKKKEFVHMLNATGFAIGRTLIGIIENYQTKEGTIRVPKALQGYAGEKEIGKRKTA